jgi:secondary thiamine-phosphate synthase enzyme
MTSPAVRQNNFVDFIDAPSTFNGRMVNEARSPRKPDSRDANRTAKAPCAQKRFPRSFAPRASVRRAETGARVMKSYRKELWFDTPGRRAFLNITPQVNEALRESGVREGLVLVNAMHITASVFINDDESGLHHDYEIWLEKLAPHEPVSGYWHNRTGEDNADAHMKRQVMGREVVVAITNGKLDFGPWEQIFYGEFDGGRRKRVLVKIIGE